MGLEEPDVVDAAGIERDSGTVVLTVADAWDWSEEQRHLDALERKLKAYVDFIVGGQIREVYPDVEARGVRIEVIGRFPIGDSGDELIRKAAIAASHIGVEVRWKHHP